MRWRIVLEKGAHEGRPYGGRCGVWVECDSPYVAFDGKKNYRVGSADLGEGIGWEVGKM